MGQTTIRKPALSEFPSWTAPSDFSPRESWSYDGYKNDACPKWVITLPTSQRNPSRAVLWVDYADPDVRDTGCPHLYSLCVYGGCDCQSDGMGGTIKDVWSLYDVGDSCPHGDIIGSEFGTDSFAEILSRLEELGASL